MSIIYVQAGLNTLPLEGHEEFGRMALNLNPDIEARLVALAQRSGISVEAFLQHIVEEKSGTALGQQLNPAEWSSQFEEWADSFPDAPPIPDEALSRENLYPDR